MNPILLDLGFIKIYWYSALILLGILVGCALIFKECKKFKIHENYMDNLLLYVIIFSIIGARLYYVAFNWPYYSKNLLEIVQIWEGGLAIHGGIIAGFIVVLCYTKKYKVNTMRILDIMSVGLIIGQAIGRWGNFFNGEAHGGITTLETLTNLHIPNFIIKGMNIYGVYYHPTFLYESLWCILGLIVLLICRRRYYNKIGQTFGLYLMWYGVGRFFIESMRTDSLMLSDFRIAQIVSIFMVITGLIVIIVKGSGSKLNNRYNDLENIDEIKF